MKPKSKKLPPKEHIDEVGRVYVAAVDQREIAETQIKEVKEEVDKLMKHAGLAAEKKAYLEGNNYRVGFYSRQGRQVFDEELFRDLYPKIYQRCLVVKPVFDQEKLMALIKSKKVPSKCLSDAMIKSADAKVIDIKTKR